ncbi:MAG TPA: SpoIVB peptidase S55 domain-containing protein [Thermoanaerobaculaceae bacterium]|nr:SpoIVB peptidase S55 domain-containing protein [Thermoanaerobaculaceae bacterium]
MGLPFLPLALAAALQWLDPSAVKPQQRGVCVTEWSGGERREIPVEVMGTLDAVAPGRSAVLVRLLDDRLTGSGVVAGMSGSPVYVDGKLLGAVAFGWSFAREPLAGVTPFETMHKLEPGGGSAGAPAPTVAQLAALADGHLEPMAILPDLPSHGGGEPQLAALGGLPEPSGFAAKLLERLGLQTVPAGGGAPGEGPPEPGEMLAVPLVWGDATLAAGGTVTAREGDKVWAFGHPLFNLGKVRMPAVRARVLAIQGSYQNPFKIFAVGKSFGTLVVDRAAGIVALAGAAPAGIPVTIDVHGPMGDATWHFRMVEEPLLAQSMVTYLTNASLTSRGAGVGQASARIAMKVDLADGRSVSLDQSGRGLDILARIAAFAGGVVGALANSPFAHPAVAGVEMRLDRDEEARGAVIAEALPARTVVAPGEALAVEVRLQPEHAAVESRRLTLRVPPDAEPGPVDLIVADGAAWSEYRLRAEGLMPADFADQLAELGLLESSATLVGVLVGHARGVAVPGASQPDLPPSWAATVATGLGPRSVTRLGSSVLAITRVPAGMPLEGAFRIPLTVRPRVEAP